MLIYTSYFAQVKNLPSDIVPISIAAKQVPGWRYPVYKALAPTYNILYDYKRDGDKDHYVTASLRRLIMLSKEDPSRIGVVGSGPSLVPWQVGTFISKSSLR